MPQLPSNLFALFFDSCSLSSRQHQAGRWWYRSRVARAGHCAPFFQVTTFLYPPSFPFPLPSMASVIEFPRLYGLSLALSLFEIMSLQRRFKWVLRGFPPMADLPPLTFPRRREQFFRLGSQRGVFPTIVSAVPVINSIFFFVPRLFPASTVPRILLPSTPFSCVVPPFPLNSTILEIVPLSSGGGFVCQYRFVLLFFLVSVFEFFFSFFFL